MKQSSGTPVDKRTRLVDRFTLQKVYSVGDCSLEKRPLMIPLTRSSLGHPYEISDEPQ